MSTSTWKRETANNDLNGYKYCEYMKQKYYMVEAVEKTVLEISVEGLLHFRYHHHYCD